MTEKNFVKMLLLVFSAVSIILGIILLCSTTGALFYCGIAAMVGGVILIITAILLSKDLLKKGTINWGKVLRITAVVLISCLLHGTGITLMVLVNWIAGLAVLLLGFVNLLFLVPAVKGFSDKNENK